MGDPIKKQFKLATTIKELHHEGYYIACGLKDINFERIPPQIWSLSAGGSSEEVKSNRKNALIRSQSTVSLAETKGKRSIKDGIEIHAKDSDYPRVVHRGKRAKSLFTRRLEKDSG